jgi:hypothetical protein
MENSSSSSKILDLILREILLEALLGFTRTIYRDVARKILEVRACLCRRAHERHSDCENVKLVRPVAIIFLGTGITLKKSSLLIGTRIAVT